MAPIIIKKNSAFDNCSDLIKKYEISLPENILLFARKNKKRRNG